MKKIHKAIKLPLIYLTALAAFAQTSNIFAEETPAETVKPVETCTVQTPVEKTPEEKVIEIFGPFFNDPKFEVKESFQTMCCKAIPYLEQSTEPGLRELAKALKGVCQQNSITKIGIALMKYADVVQKHFGKTVDKNILKARLHKALTIK